jgi:hypothetical protein
MCSKCGKELSGQILVAMEQKWHVECFVCSQCDRVIEGGFVTRGYLPWCKSCVDWSKDEKPIKNLQKGGKIEEKSTVSSASSSKNIIAPDVMQGFKTKECVSCSKKVTAGVDYAGKSFCLECFKCIKCRQMVDPEQGFLPQGSGVMCANCASQSNSKSAYASAGECGQCSESIHGTYTKVDGILYHKECFVCSNCSGSLATGFAQVGKKKLCVSCAQSHGTVSAESVPMAKPISGIRVNMQNLSVKKVDHNKEKEKEAKPSSKSCKQCGNSGKGKFCTSCGNIL